MEKRELLEMLDQPIPTDPDSESDGNLSDHEGHSHNYD